MTSTSIGCGGLAGHLRRALRQLQELGQAPQELFLRMARFRNLLVHLYAKVDDAEVYRIIREDLGDFERYLASLAQYLKAELC